MSSGNIEIGDWQLDPNANTVFNEHDSTKLEHKQVQLLLYLLSRAGEMVSKEDLLREIWGGRVVVEDVISVSISRLRKALKDKAQAPQFIKTIPGKGYRFIFPLPEAVVALAEKIYAENNLGRDADEKIPAAQSPVKHHSVATPRLKLHYTMAIFVIALSVVSTAIIWSTQNARQITANTANTYHVLESLPLDIQEDYKQALEYGYSYEEESASIAVEMLEKILRHYPDFAEAYVQLAKIKRNLLFRHPRIEYNASTELKALLNKALIIDPHLSSAHETLGLILFFVDWNHSEARVHFERAIELDPESPDAHHSYGLFLLAHGEFDQSYTHIVRARELNPLYYSIASVAWIFAMQDRHEEAWQETEKLLTLQPNKLQYHRSAQRLFENAGDDQQAYYHLRKILELADYTEKELAEVDTIYSSQALAGVYHWLAYTRKEDRDIGFYPAPLSLARFAISAGEYDDAFAWLNEAMAQRQGLLLWLKVDPKYKAIRNDPRYFVLLEKLGLNN